MKQISIAVNIIFFFVFLFFVSFGQKNQTDNSIQKNKILKLIQENRMLKLQIQKQCPPCTDCNKYQDVPGLISVATAQELANNYRDYLVNNTNQFKCNTDQFKDAQSVWFSLDAIKAFICLIEKANSDTCKKFTLGIRIYYGKYPCKNEMDSNRDLQSLHGLNYENHHTVFLVPTYQDNLNPIENYDFNPLSMSNCVPTKFDTSNEKATAILSSMSKNHGDLIPPSSPVDGASFIRQ